MNGQGEKTHVIFLRQRDTQYIQVWKTSMPKLLGVTGGTKTKIYCQGTIHQRCVLAALRTVKLGLNKIGNQAKPLKYSGRGERVFCTNLEQMFKCTALIHS